MFNTCEWIFNSRDFRFAWEDNTSCKECLKASGLLTRSVRKQISEIADDIMAAQEVYGGHRKIVLGLEYEYNTEYVPSPWIAPRRHKSESVRGFRSRLIVWIYNFICNRIVGIGEYYELPDDDAIVGIM